MNFTLATTENGGIQVFLPQIITVICGNYSRLTVVASQHRYPRILRQRLPFEKR
jgi:hypothetical protein